MLYIYLHRWQASPVNPMKHVQDPVTLLHSPAFEHSACACAAVVDVGTSTQALPEGQAPTINKKN